MYPIKSFFLIRVRQIGRCNLLIIFMLKRFFFLRLDRHTNRNLKYVGMSDEIANKCDEETNNIFSPIFCISYHFPQHLPFVLQQYKICEFILHRRLYSIK